MLAIPGWPQAGPRELELVQAVLSSAQWGGFHPFVAEFEAAFAVFTGTRHGVSACNGTLTLELAWTLLGLRPGDEVIVPAASFISTATSVSRAGAVPVFVDVEPWSFNMDPAAVEAAIGPKTRAIVAVHFGGAPANLDALIPLARRHGLELIEDAAHAHGSEWRGQRAGSFGVLGSFSFQNGKVLTAGEGGILVTSSDQLAAAARSVANQGRRPGHSFYEHFVTGSNLRLSGLQAAVLLAQLEHLETQNARRAASARLLKRLLAGLPEIRWQEEPDAMTANSYYLLPGRLCSGIISRDVFCSRLRELGVPCTPFYPHLLYENPVYREAPCRVLPCPNAEACLQDAFWLPHRVLLAEEETIQAVAQVILGAAAGTRLDPAKV